MSYPYQSILCPPIAYLVSRFTLSSVSVYFNVSGTRTHDLSYERHKPYHTALLLSQSNLVMATFFDFKPLYSSLCFIYLSFNFYLSFLNGPFLTSFLYFRLFNTIDIKQCSIYRFCQWLDMNRGSLESGAIPLPTKPLLPFLSTFVDFFFLSDSSHISLACFFTFN